MDNAVSFPFDIPTYRQLRPSYDPESESLWCYLDPRPRPTFNLELLAEIEDLQQRVVEYSKTKPGRRVRYFVAASARPAIFNLGGDLVLFNQLIEARDRAGLLAYGRACINAVYRNATNLGLPELTTISLVQGSALGGGFEAALSSNVIIAERSAQMGFPETLFNLFPGMGAFNLLIRRLSPIHAERIIYSGSQYNAEELHEMGLVDHVVEDGMGVVAIRQFIRRHERSRNGYLAIKQVRDRLIPFTYSDLMEVVNIWVDAALRLTPRDLRMMARLANVQYRLSENMDLAGAEPTRETVLARPQPTAVPIMNFAIAPS